MASIVFSMVFCTSVAKVRPLFEIFFRAGSAFNFLMVLKEKEIVQLCFFSTKDYIFLDKRVILKNEDEVCIIKRSCVT